jgi:hypothetical protein
VHTKLVYNHPHTLVTAHKCSFDLPFFKRVEKTIDEFGKTVNPENHLFNRKSRTLSFASWQNFASIENTTFRDLKCVHGPRELQCAHSGHPESFCNVHTFLPRILLYFFYYSIFNRSCKVLTSFCATARPLNTKANIDGSKLKVTWEAKRI